MATLPDIQLLSNAYIDVYAVTGIEHGKPVTVQNKSSSPVYLQNRLTQPPAISNDGFYMSPSELVSAVGELEGLWAKGSGKISVEEIK